MTLERCPACNKLVKNLKLHDRWCPNNPAKKSNPAPASAYEEKRLAPGSYYRPNEKTPPSKIPWTRDMIEKGFKKVMLINPPESCPVTFQGVTIYIRGGIDQEVPEPYAAIYRDYLRSRNLPVMQPVGVTPQQRANQVAHQGFGAMESLPEEG